MKFIPVLGLLLASSSSFAADYQLAFYDKTMDKEGGEYILEAQPNWPIHASILEIDITIDGNAELSSKYKKVCTKWQNGDCIGAYKNILHSEFFHEESVKLYCDDKVIYDVRKNNSEYSNEVIDDASCSLTFKDTLISLQPYQCTTIKLAINTQVGDKEKKVAGTISFKNSTSKPNLKITN